MTNLRSRHAEPTGVAALDHEHTQLIDTIGEICAQVTRDGGIDPVADALGLLYVRICAHFALEEKVMRQRSPELYTAHKLKYEALLDRVRIMMDAFEDGQCDFCDKSLQDCLLAVLGQHVHDEHRQIAEEAARLGVCADA
jgi:hemerythrin-like metal-binding protein